VVVLVVVVVVMLVLSSVFVSLFMFVFRICSIYVCARVCISKIFHIKTISPQHDKFLADAICTKRSAIRVKTLRITGGYQTYRYPSARVKTHAYVEAISVELAILIPWRSLGLKMLKNIHRNIFNILYIMY
jgi:hypothetical protein